MNLTWFRYFNAINDMVYKGGITLGNIYTILIKLDFIPGVLIGVPPAFKDTTYLDVWESGTVTPFHYYRNEIIGNRQILNRTHGVAAKRNSQDLL